MKNLIILGPDNVFYRAELFAVHSAEDVIARMVNKTSVNIPGHTSFNVATGCNATEVTYGRVSFNLTVNSNMEAIYWQYLPGICIDTTFILVERHGEPRVLCDFDRSCGDSFSDRMWCSASNLSVKGIEFRFVFAIAIIGGEMHPNFCIQLWEGGKLLGNFTPPIPNIYTNGKVCMGNNFPYRLEPAKNTEENIQRAITWFFESKTNTDLITQEGAARMASSQKLFGWDKNKKQLAPLDSPKNLFTSRIGNIFFDAITFPTQ